MKSTAFLHYPSYSESFPMERREPTFEEMRAFRKALERWENEGGRIPELWASRQVDRRPGGGVAPNSG